MHNWAGHLCCCFTILIWGLTFVATKILLAELTPFEILFDRCLLAFVALLIITRTVPQFISVRYSFYCILAALCGNNIYFILENHALTYSYASNVSVIVSTAPLFTALLSHLLLKGEVLSRSFFLGFFLAMLGTVCLWWSSLKLQLNPLGDLLSLLAALSWAMYTLIIRKLVLQGFVPLQITVSLFFWALILLVPLLPLYGYELKFSTLCTLQIGGNLLFLSVLASALGFLLWNKAVRLIGPVKTAVYIYAQPIVTACAASFMLYEIPTVYTLLGIVLIIAGLMVSEHFDLRALLFRTRE